MYTTMPKLIEKLVQKPTEEPIEKPFLHFVIEPALLKQLEDFRFKHRFPTRTAAIKWLLVWALKQKPVPKGTEK
jgi:hypothetical protein